MTRETRANLIFLLLLLAILTPGAVILFRKKLAPTLKPMGMPEAVSREIAYLSPLETPPGKRRVEPPHTAKWVESLVRYRVKENAIVRPQDHDALPLVSDKKTFQIVAAVNVGRDPLKLYVIDWAPEVKPSHEWAAYSNQGKVKGYEIGAERIEVPDLVREELGETGLVRPPHEIVWQVVELKLGQADRVELRHARGDGNDFVNFVPSFTNSATTGN